MKPLALAALISVISTLTIVIVGIRQRCKKQKRLDKLLEQIRKDQHEHYIKTRNMLNKIEVKQPIAKNKIEEE